MPCNILASQEVRCRGIYLIKQNHICILYFNDHLVLVYLSKVDTTLDAACVRVLPLAALILGRLAPGAMVNGWEFETCL
jgi:hypothetical protein